MNDRALLFVEELNEAWRNGVNPWACLVHAWHETAGFTRIIGDHNYFGITASASYVETAADSLKVQVVTHEMMLTRAETREEAMQRAARNWGNCAEAKLVNGKYWDVTVERWFRDWVSCKLAIRWYCGLIQRMYPLSFAAAENAPLYYSGLVTGENKWATDPYYIEELAKVDAELRQQSGITNLVSAVTNGR